MKHMLCALVTLLVFAGSTGSARHVRTCEGESDSGRITVIKDVLIQGLWSDDPIQLRGATFAVRRLMLRVPGYDWDQFIIPLMHVVNDDRHDTDARIMAAVILFDLKSERGDFLIARKAIFADDARLKRCCDRLTRARSAADHGRQ